MLQKLRGNNAKGFTLIELMIVIAIIGILAAIAIPNFISYRDKAFCSAAETDLDSVMGAIADYFAEPDNQTVSKANLTGVNLSGDPANDWDVADNAATGGYTVTITDSSGRCPRFTTITKAM